jgi:lipoprotein-releasing system permease protein
MGFPLELALRYMSSKKRAFVSVGTLFAIFGVALGVAALATVMSVTGGFRAQFRDKVLGVNAHVLVLKRSSDFSEYRDVMKKVEDVPGVVGIAPFAINPMMVTHGERTATGVLLKGVDPERVGQVLDLPEHIKEGSLEGLRRPGAKPAERRRGRLGANSTVQPPKGPVTKDGLLDEIQRLIKEDEKAEAPGAEQEAVAAGPTGEDDVAPEALPGPLEVAQQPVTPTPAEADEEEAVAPSAAASDHPEGSIVPEGGYGAELPEDDILPTDLLPDPCKSDQSALPGIVLGRTLSQNLDARIGSCVRVTSPTIGLSFSRDTIRAPVAKEFRVIAVFDAGFDQYDSRLVYTDLYEAQEFYDTGDSVTGIEMKVDDIDNARNIARAIDERLGAGLHYTMDWEELNHGLFTALRIQQIVMSLVLALIIVVAAFTVIATLIMVVLDKKREIAVLKAMGATNGHVLWAFLYQGGIIGLFGAAIGLGLGLLVCKGLLIWAVPLDPQVYFISHLPVDVQPLEFAMVGVFAVAICLLATVWPALHAARLRPAEAFRE